MLSHALAMHVAQVQHQSDVFVHFLVVFCVSSGHELESEAKLEKGGKSLGRLVQLDHSKESWEWHSGRADFYCSSCINYKYLYSNSHRIMQSSHQQSLTHEGVPTKIVLTAVLYRSFLMSLLVSIL